jgi:hypothetical protein
MQFTKTKMSPFFSRTSTGATDSSIKPARLLAPPIQIFKYCVSNSLFNGDNETMDIQLDDSFDDLNRCFVRRIQESEVKEALKR